MAHSFNKIWIHAIWSTKNRSPLINFEIERQVYQYMGQQFAEIGCSVRIINGMPDHIHALFLLNPQKSIADVIKQVKGSTTHWLNHDFINMSGFSWQTGYAAFSVSESQLDKVFLYIKNQKRHHQNWLFQQELDTFLQRNKIENG